MQAKPNGGSLPYYHWMIFILLVIVCCIDYV